VTSALFTLVRRARVESGETGTTGAERDMAEVPGIRTFVTSVARVEEVHPHLRRIVFGGGDLAGFEPLGPDTFVYVLLPPPGGTELTVDAAFTWEAHRRTPEEERAVGAYYTVRRWDPVRREIEALFVLHGDEGHASAWAGRAAVGDPVALWGPRTSYAPPADTEWYLLVADETGLPAVAAIIESLPEQVPVRVLAEVGSVDEHQPLPERDTVEVTWLHRDGVPAGTTTLLADAVSGLSWRGGRAYAFGGGESRAMTDVRAHLRRVVGLRRDQVSMVAYWRHDT
jgi:NADPH-dependent ferric siderophore reductase